MLDSTVDYTDGRGFHYVGMSASWKKLCLALPCSERVVIPPVYRTAFRHVTIDGHDVVIQAWKGDCPKGVREMPGGIGGEVGIYRNVPGRTIPDVLDLPVVEHFPAALRPIIVAVVSRIVKGLVEVAESGVELWWPFPELDAQIDMRFTHGGRDFFTATPEPAGGYWMSRWMNYGSYAKYALGEIAAGHPPPVETHAYRMELAVKGRRFVWGDGGIEDA